MLYEFGAFFHRHWRKLALWTVMFGICCAGNTWMEFLREYYADPELVVRHVGEGIEQTTVAFVLAVIPINYLGVLRRGLAAVRLRSPGGALVLTLAAYVLLWFAGIRQAPVPAIAAMHCTAVCTLILLATGPLDTRGTWFLPTLCVALLTVLFFRFPVRADLLASMPVALACASAAAAGTAIQRERPGGLDRVKTLALILVPAAVCVTCMMLTDPETVATHMAVWSGREVNTVTWYSAADTAFPRESLSMHISMCLLNATGCAVLMLASRRAAPEAKYSARTAVTLDALLIAYGLLVWYNILPSSLTATLPFRTPLTSYLAALTVNNLMYSPRTPSPEKAE